MCSPRGGRCRVPLNHVDEEDEDEQGGDPGHTPAGVHLGGSPPESPGPLDIVLSKTGCAPRSARVGFDRKTLCFALSAVDEAANLGPKSDAVCLDTTDETGAVVTEGRPCVGCGCTGTTGLLGLAATLVWGLRRRAGRAPTLSGRAAG